MLPPALSEAVNGTGVPPEATAREPVVVAGSCWRTEAGTVKVPAPAVVRQMNEVLVVTRLLPVPVEVEDEPMISTTSEELPPVQLRVSGLPRFTVAGRPPVTVIGGARFIATLNVPTSVPPAP